MTKLATLNQDNPDLFNTRSISLGGFVFYRGQTTELSDDDFTRLRLLTTERSGLAYIIEGSFSSGVGRVDSTRGPAGPPGPPGIHWRDDVNGALWDADTLYTPNDAVVHSDKTWRAVRTNQGSEPTSDNPDWLALPSGPPGPQGAAGLGGAQGPPGTTDHDMLTNVRPSDLTSSNNVLSTHPTNAQLKNFEDHRNITSGDPHGSKASTLADLISTASGKGASLVGFKSGGTGAQDTTVSALLGTVYYSSKFDTLQHALDTAAGNVLILDAAHNISSGVTVSDGTQILGRPGSKIYNTTTHMKIVTLGSNIALKAVEIQGAGNSVLNTAGYGVYCVGTSNSVRKSDIVLRDCYIHDIGQSATWWQWTDRVTIDNCRIWHAGAHGVVTEACDKINVINGTHVKDITPGQASGTAYGVAFTVDSSNNRTTNSRVNGCIIEDCLSEDGLNTHAGQNIIFSNNIIKNCAMPVDVGNVGSGAGAVAPKQVKIINNIIIGNSGDTAIPAQVQGIRIAGAPQTVDVAGTAIDWAEDCEVRGNLLYYGGMRGQAALGAITVRISKNTKVEDNTIIGATPHAIVFYESNTNFSAAKNTIVDWHDNSVTFVAGIYVDSDQQTGYIGENVFRNGGTYILGSDGVTPDTYVCVNGLYVSSTTGVKLNMGKNYFDGVTTHYGGNFVEGLYDWGPDINRSGWKRPVRAAQTASLPAYTTSGNTLTANANGALPVFDVSVTLARYDRVLIYREGSFSSPVNGIYYVADPGSVSTPWILTRTTDADIGTKFTPRFAFMVSEGNTWAGQFFFYTGTTFPTLGSTNIAFGNFQPRNQTVNGSVTYVPASTVTVTAGSAISIFGSTIPLTSTADVTVTAAPTIAALTSGTRIRLINVGTHNITLQDRGTLTGSLLALTATTITLGPRQNIELEYNSTVGLWVQCTPLVAVL